MEKSVYDYISNEKSNKRPSGNQINENSSYIDNKTRLVQCPFNDKHYFSKMDTKSHLYDCPDAKNSGKTIYFCINKPSQLYIGKKVYLKHLEDCETCFSKVYLSTVNTKNNFDFLNIPNNYTYMHNIENYNTNSKFSYENKSIPRHLRDNKKLLRKCIKNRYEGLNKGNNTKDIDSFHINFNNNSESISSNNGYSTNQQDSDIFFKTEDIKTFNNYPNEIFELNRYKEKQVREKERKRDNREELLYSQKLKSISNSTSTTSKNKSQKKYEKEKDKQLHRISSKSPSKMLLIESLNKSVKEPIKEIFEEDEMLYELNKQEPYLATTFNTTSDTGDIETLNHTIKSEVGEISYVLNGTNLY